MSGQDREETLGVAGSCSLEATITAVVRPLGRVADQVMHNLKRCEPVRRSQLRPVEVAGQVMVEGRCG